MELTVLGATGGTGRQVVQQALEAGHSVTAVVRDPSRLPVTGAGLTVVTADVTDPESLLPALEGRDAAISALGPRGRKQARIAAAGTRAILSALDTCGVRRFAAVSAAPVGPLPEGEGVVARTVLIPLLWAVFRDVYTDLAAMEGEIRRSSADWTIVWPPRLTDKPVTGTYRRVGGGNVPHGRSISRADLAHALLAVLDEPTAGNRAWGLRTSRVGGRYATPAGRHRSVRDPGRPSVSCFRPVTGQLPRGRLSGGRVGVRGSRRP
ncbi:SDR family oxidoreductase [Streptomyces sp. NPDC004647]|uniref:NAD(P)-dependent oxidoreductase n=1 Tax=Streptomyces sp. NPDC004647 TaxID=3154671 RepID=UPI0033B429DE